MKRGYMVCPNCKGRKYVPVGETKKAQCNLCYATGEVKKSKVREEIVRQLSDLQEHAFKFKMNLRKWNDVDPEFLGIGGVDDEMIEAEQKLRFIGLAMKKRWNL